MMSDHKKRIDDVMEPLHGEERKSDGDGTGMSGILRGICISEKIRDIGINKVSNLGKLFVIDTSY